MLCNSVVFSVVAQNLPERLPCARPLLPEGVSRRRCPRWGQFSKAGRATPGISSEISRIHRREGRVAHFYGLDYFLHSPAKWRPMFISSIRTPRPKRVSDLSKLTWPLGVKAGLDPGGKSPSSILYPRASPYMLSQTFRTRGGGEGEGGVSEEGERDSDRRALAS